MPFSDAYLSKFKDRQSIIYITSGDIIHGSIREVRNGIVEFIDDDTPSGFITHVTVPSIHAISAPEDESEEESDD